MNDDDKFKKHLAQSQGAVWKVAQYLSSKGHPITIPPTFVAPSHQEWKEYADDGDIYMGQRIEVKQRGFSFSGRGEWPYESFMVCAKHSFDRAKPKPYRYYYLNKSETHAAIVMGSSHKSWYCETKKDSRYEDMVQDCYMCPMHLVKFISL
jgi:hypothetical protein